MNNAQSEFGRPEVDFLIIEGKIEVGRFTDKATNSLWCVTQAEQHHFHFTK